MSPILQLGVRKWFVYAMDGLSLLKNYAVSRLCCAVTWQIGDVRDGGFFVLTLFLNNSAGLVVLAN